MTMYGCVKLPLLNFSREDARSLALARLSFTRRVRHVLVKR